MLALSPGPLTLRLKLVAARAELGNGLLRQQLLERPLLNVLRLVLLELRDKLDGTSENAALVLLTSWYNFGKFVDAFIDRLPTPALNCNPL